jgi:hypothetical protein
MDIYPEILLPRPSYPLLENKEVSSCALVRETPVDVHAFLAKPGYEPDDILSLIVAPQFSLREVFELSIFLFGYYDERHIGIRVDDTAFYADWEKNQPKLRVEDIRFTQKIAYPLFLAASKLDCQEIDYNEETHTLSFSHRPTRVNYWHFELWIKDSAGNRIPRDKSNVHTKYLAKSILEYIAAEAINSKADFKPFKRSDFDWKAGVSPPV